jgi:LmbE family N-acetylglucosaminyl deacetylase
VTTLIVCEGSTVRYGGEFTQEIESESRRANEILGIDDLRFLRLPDQGLDSMSLIDISRRIEEVVAEIQPEAVYTHSSSDLNRDHRIVMEAVMVATRPFAAPSVREVWLFETSSSTEWGGPPLLPPFQPQLFVDITATLEIKIKALECYRREIRTWPHPRSAKGTRARAQYWGSQAGFEAAEPFEAIRLLR